MLFYVYIFTLIQCINILLLKKILSAKITVDGILKKLLFYGESLKFCQLKIIRKSLIKHFYFIEAHFKLFLSDNGFNNILN